MSQITNQTVEAELLKDKIVENETAFIYSDWSGKSVNEINLIIDSLVKQKKVVDKRS